MKKVKKKISNANKQVCAQQHCAGSDRHAQYKGKVLRLQEKFDKTLEQFKKDYPCVKLDFAGMTIQERISHLAGVIAELEYP